MKTRLLTVLVACLGLAFTSGARAQAASSGGIGGTLFNDATGAFVEGAEIIVQTAPPRSTVTDSQGRFFLGGISPGDYRVRIVSAGFTPVEQSAAGNQRHLPRNAATAAARRRDEDDRAPRPAVPAANSHGQ